LGEKYTHTYTHNVKNIIQSAFIYFLLCYMNTTEKSLEIKQSFQIFILTII